MSNYEPTIIVDGAHVAAPKMYLSDGALIIECLRCRTMVDDREIIEHICESCQFAIMDGAR